MQHQLSICQGKENIINYIFQNIIIKALKGGYVISDITHGGYRHGSSRALIIRLKDKFWTVYSISYDDDMPKIQAKKIMNEVLDEIYRLINRKEWSVDICDSCREIIREHKICECKEIHSNDDEYDGFVYFLKVQDDKIKIGFKKGDNPNILERIKQYRAGIPFVDEEIKIIKYVKGSRKKEKEFHRRFEKHSITNEWFKLKGYRTTTTNNEWFRYEGELKDYIEQEI